MKRAPRISFTLLLAVSCWGFGLSVVYAQKSEEGNEYVITARAGGINAVEGQATYRSEREDNWRQLLPREQLRSGSAIRTGSDGRVEILLNPGSYLRIAENSEVVLTSVSLDDLRINVISGNVIVEAANVPRDGDGLLKISTPHTSVAIVRSGLYRINVSPSGSTEVLVRNGRAMVGEVSAERINEGRKLVVYATQTVPASVVRFNRDVRDDFDLWSRKRAGDLALANRRLQQNTLSTTLASYSNDDSFNSGYWVYDRRHQCYVYLPSGSYSSPYGFSHNNAGRQCGSCSHRTRPNQGGEVIAGGGNGNSGGGNSGGGTNPGSGDATPQPSPPTSTPPPSPPVERTVDRPVSEQPEASRPGERQIERLATP